MTTSQWWKETIIYQIYPRSFKDSNGDGIGDLQGVLSQADYIASLGIGTVWLNPVYCSPNTDNGYDISDYRNVAPEFGNMETLEKLIAALHDRGIRLIMDMVLNHSSDEHEWFRQARTDRTNPYYSFYHWWPMEKGKPPYRCGFFDPAGEGWTFNEPTQSYYLHYFSNRQPDLNWENPDCRKELYEIMRFWLDKGVDGFRMDAITFISKDTSFPPITPEILSQDYAGDWGHYYASGPNLHAYLREMHDLVFAHYDAVTLAEGPGIRAEQALDFVSERRQELDMLTHFEGITIGYLPGEFKKVDPGGYDVRELKKVYSRWSEVFDEEGWGTLYLGNHDQPRMVSRWGDDSDAFRKVSAKLLFTFLLTMRSTPLIYNGDELGMNNIRFTKIEDYEDIETLHMYQKIRNQGGDTEAFLQDQQLAARDNSRTPFQWTSEPNAGFTTGSPWVKVNDNHVRTNVAAAETDPDSILNFFRQLILFRKEHPVFIAGSYTLLAPDDPNVYAYSRLLEGAGFLVLLNFSKSSQVFMHSLPFFPGARRAFGNYPDTGSGEGWIQLLPYEAVIFEI